MNGAQSILIQRGSTDGLFRRLWGVDAHLSERSLAAIANVLPNAVVRDVRHEVPAAGAFVAGGLVDLDAEIATPVKLS